MTKRKADANWDEFVNEDSNGLPTPASSTCSKSRDKSIVHNRKTPNSVIQVPLPRISKKITACVECRKRKVKCFMREGGLPCRRCAKQNLDCVLGKNLQTIVNETSQFSEIVLKDVKEMHLALTAVLDVLDLPELSPLLSSPTSVSNNSSEVRTPSSPSDGPSYDTSPKVPENDGFPHVPIESLYALTKLSSLRLPDPITQPKRIMKDFIARGLLSLVDAERLFVLYRDRLDLHIYGIGCQYQTLEELRQKSPILTAASLTVAALHDPKANGVYGVCSFEFRRLVKKSMFEPCVDRDFVRAMCIASYWLSDISWMVLGYAIRRAAEFDLDCSPSRVNEGNLEAADSTRLWYLLFICDQQLATLYRRPPMIHKVPEWESFLMSAVSTEDKRLVSQIELMNILSSIRETFSDHKGEPTRVHSYFCHFRQQLDHWHGRWLRRLPESFPHKEMLLNYNFVQLYLYSHVFQGLPSDEVLSLHFINALDAINAAIAIVKIITEPDVSTSMGMPSYIYSMTAFACMFLIKVAVQFYDQFVEKAHVYELISATARQFRALSVGKWHLAHLMEEGLEKELEQLDSTPSPLVNEMISKMDVENYVDNSEYTHGTFLLDDDLYFGLPSVLQFDQNIESML